MIRLLTTLATAAFVVWVANHATQRVDPEVWRAPAEAVREGLSQALREAIEPESRRPTSAPAASEVEREARASASEATHAGSASHPETASAPKEPAAPAEPVAAVSLTPDQTEAIRCRLERVMQLARVAAP